MASALPNMAAGALSRQMALLSEISLGKATSEDEDFLEKCAPYTSRRRCSSKLPAALLRLSDWRLDRGKVTTL